MFKRRPFRTLNQITINQEALKHNVRLYQSMRPDLSICPVLKSNAYGHGLTLVAKALDPMKLNYFIVDSLYEAFQLRDEKIKTPILVLGYTFPDNFKKKLPFHFTAFDLDSLELHSKLGHPIHIEVDTGMNRMGFNLDQLSNALNKAKEWNSNIVGLFSHFATADEGENKYFKEQEKEFEKAIHLTKEHGFTPKWVHIGNSAGGPRSKINDLNMMRLGLSLYGISPDQKVKNLKPAAEVSSTLIATRELKKGESVSYGATFTAQKDMKIAVIPFGYYEGLDRNQGNNESIEINGEICRIIGRICMNHTMIDVSNINVKPGDRALIYSANPNSPLSFSNQSKKSKIIPYELMVRLSESIRRVIN